MMTSDMFRQQEDLRLEIAGFLKGDVGMLVLRILKEKGRPMDVPSNTDALASVRVLSHFHGYNSAIDELELLAHPYVPPAAQLETTFGALDTDQA
jgi:hypothetical protein